MSLPLRASDHAARIRSCGSAPGNFRVGKITSPWLTTQSPAAIPPRFDNLAAKNPKTEPVAFRPEIDDY
jgi:hypothetical protein